jgi:hypothetical protein
VANNASCGRGCGHSRKMVIFHLLIAAVAGRVNGWFNEGVLVLAGACSMGVVTGIAEYRAHVSIHHEIL